MPIDEAEKRDAESGCGEKEMPRLELRDEESWTGTDANTRGERR